MHEQSIPNPCASLDFHILLPVGLRVESMLATSVATTMVANASMIGVSYTTRDFSSSHPASTKLSLDSLLFRTMLIAMRSSRHGTSCRFVSSTVFKFHKQALFVWSIQKAHLEALQAEDRDNHQIASPHVIPVGT